MVKPHCFNRQNKPNWIINDSILGERWKNTEITHIYKYFKDFKHM